MAVAGLCDFVPLPAGGGSAAPADSTSSNGPLVGLAAGMHGQRSRRAWAPSQMLLGCCRLDHAADAPSSGAVGRGGIGQFGVLMLREFQCAKVTVAWNSFRVLTASWAMYHAVLHCLLAARVYRGTCPEQRAESATSPSTATSTISAFHVPVTRGKTWPPRWLQRRASWCSFTSRPLSGLLTAPRRPDVAAASAPVLLARMHRVGADARGITRRRGRAG